MKTVKVQQGLSPVWVHAGLAALAVVFAYQTWTRDRAQTQTDSVVVLDAAKREVNSLAYEDEMRQITVERRNGADGESYAWILTKTRSKVPVSPPVPQAAPVASSAPPMAAPVAPTAPAPKPGMLLAPPVKGGDKSGEPAMPAGHPPLPGGPSAGPLAAPIAPAASPPAPPVEMKEVTTLKEYRGNDAATELLGLFGPLKALRALGAIDDAKAKELGLTDSKKSLTVNAKGLTYKFVLGGTSYGSGDYYVRDPQGQVFLLSQRIIADFEFADSRLMERRLHRFERADFDRIEVKVGDKTRRSIVQGGRQNPQGFFFAEAATPDKRDDSLKNWVEKLLRLSIGDYLAQGEEPATGAPSMSGAAKTGELITVRFFEGRKELGNMVLSRYPNAKTSQAEYYARTETSIALVRLLAATAESVITDAEKW